jgi:hypothetical protein
MKIIAGLLIAAALAFASGCAKTDWIDRTLVTVDVTGTWSGRIGEGSSLAQDISLELKQEGSRVTGSMRLIPSARLTGTVPIDGSVAGDVFRFRDSTGSAGGELTVSGDEMNGRAQSPQGDSRPASLRRVDPSSRPASPPR